MKKIICVLLLLLLSCFAEQAAANLQYADKVVVSKKKRVLLLLKNGEVLKKYRIAIGRNPIGPKLRKGDGKTPEGEYVLDGRNPNSRFYRSIHISYPNPNDINRAERKGVAPGSAIMIHGLPRNYEDVGALHTVTNWTRGCIAVTNAEIDEIWSLVQDGTPIEIRP